MTQRDEIEALERQLLELKRRRAELRRQGPYEPVENYTLQGAGGSKVKLSELFGDRDDLVVVHNMGRSCPYCTLWADGYNGLLSHLEDRTAFAVVSPDDPPTQQAFAAERGWKFRLYSGQGSTFIEDMGYRSDDGDWLPGVSTFRRTKDGKIERVATAPFGPGDDFCSVWHFFDLLADGVADWEPKYRY